MDDPLQSAASAIAMRPLPLARPTLDDAALYGLAGEIVRAIEPHTEADPAAVLACLLTGFGNTIGHATGWKHGGTKHALNLYSVIVGPTASGRKGTAWGESRRVLEMADCQWAADCLTHGLSSGEGLIHAVRDPQTHRLKAKTHERGEADAEGYIEETTDFGVSDKRLLVVEAEFAQALKVMRREGNTLSPTVRTLWESGDARTMTRREPLRTTGAHVSIIGNISADELRIRLDDSEVANGFANRFSYWYAERSKQLPRGGNLTDEDLAPLAHDLSAAIDNGRHLGCLEMADGAWELWDARYADLTADLLGLLGSIVARRAQIVRRVAVLYALLDRAKCVGVEHLQAALAVEEYTTKSAALIFGQSLGRPLVDRLRALLREAGIAGLTRSSMRERIGNRTPADKIDRALSQLEERGLARVEQDQTAGRKAEHWYTVEEVEQR